MTETEIVEAVLCEDQNSRNERVHHQPAWLQPVRHQSESKSQTWFRQTWFSLGGIIIGALAVFSVIGNFVVAYAFFEIEPWRSEVGEFLLSSSNGLLVAQACLVGIWFALGAQSFLLRTLLSAALLFGISSLFVFTLRFLDSSVPAEVAAIILAIAFALPAVLSIPMWLFRYVNRQMISRSDVSMMAGQNQFSILHLLIAMGVSAVLISIAQVAFSQLGFEARSAPWFEIVCFIAIYMFLTCLVSLLAVVVVFNPRGRIVSIAGLVIAILLGAFGACATMSFSFTSFSNDFYMNFVNSIGYATFLAIGVVGALSIFYAAGYRARQIQA